MITYEIELDNPDAFVVVEAPDNATREQILEIAIAELTRNTKIWKLKKLQ